MPGRDVSLNALGAVAGEAGARAMAYWGPQSRSRLEHWEKTPGQPVSNADLLVDDYLKARLSELAPDAAWLSEETIDDPVRIGSDRLWLVDPIDGTRDFVRGRPGWAVSIALAERGAVVLAALAAPARGELWLAARGQGATCNGAALTASRRDRLPGARVPAETLPAADRDLVSVDKPNSIALRMAMVAADRADVVATVRWGWEWDIAAASLIVAEAGGAVTDALGGTLAFNREKPVALGMLCCARGIHDAAVGRLRKRALKLMGEG